MVETVHPAVALEKATAALLRVGATPAIAAAQAAVLVEAERRQTPSHGLLRLERLVQRIRNGVANPATCGQQTWRHAALLDVDGQRGLGPAVALAALDALGPRARQTGVAVAAIRNSNHIGMLAYYADRVARAGQVAIVLSTSEALVHPWGGKHALLGTNPIAIGVPASPHPFVLDMATSRVSMGKIHDYANRGEPLPPGWALDADGLPTEDAHAAKAGALAPFGQAKGYALGLAFEVLVASLTGSALGTDVKGTLDSDQVCNKGDVFVVAEPSGTGVAAAVSAYLDTVRASPRTDPDVPVAVPGDRAQRVSLRAEHEGITVPSAVWQTVLALAQGR